MKTGGHFPCFLFSKKLKKTKPFGLLKSIIDEDVFTESNKWL